MSSLVVAGGAVWGLSVTPAVAGEPDGPSASATDLDLLDTGPTTLPGQPRGPRKPKEPSFIPPTPPPPPADEREWFGFKPWTDWTHATGDWGGLRTKLDEIGLSINASYVLDWSSVLSGGVEKTSSVRQLFDANAGLNFEKAFGLKGGTAYVDFQASFSGGGSADVGDFQGVSSISTGGKNIHQISQLWYEQKLLDDALRFKLGKIDATSEFDFVKCCGDFLNSAGINTVNALSSLPTFPNPATGVVAFVYPAEWCYVGGGLFDGATQDGFRTGPRGASTFFSDTDSASWYWIGEGGATWNADLGAGRCCVGVWHHTATFATFAGATQDGNTGVYVLGEQQVWRRGTSDELKDKGLTLFAHAGFSDKDVTAVPFSVAGGVVLKGTFESRGDDAAGFLAALASFSDAPGATFDGDELALEWYYKVQLTPAVSVTPDLQYIVNPGGNPTLNNALVGAVRVAVTF